MLGDRFYHRCFAAMLLAAGLGARAAEPVAEVGVDAAAIRLPPRSINDITRMLADYRQNDDLLRKLRAVAEAPVPQGEERKLLFDFYWRRGQAAGELGQVQQQIDDLTLAVQYGQSGDPEFSRAMRGLAQATHSLS